MRLSEREKEVLALIVNAFLSQEIAQELQTKSLIGLTKYTIQEGMIGGLLF